MERFLLFDSGCSVCSELAREIEQQSKGWMVARSLRDPEIQATLDRHQPGWRWEPTLLEIDDSRVRVYTGLEMRGRILVGLGVQRTWRIARLLSRFGVPISGMQLGRRDFLRQTGAIFAGLAILGLPGKWKLGEGAGSASSGPAAAEGELYAGFILLPEGAPVPPFVKYPKKGIPIVCGVGVGRGGPDPTAVSESLADSRILAKRVNFPVYDFAQLDKEMRHAGATVISHQTGELFAAVLDFESREPQTGNWVKRASLWAEPDFPHPFPLWSGNPVEPDGPATILEKVDFLPNPGIMVATPNGHVFHWIKDDVLYTLILEATMTLEASKGLVTALARVR